MRLLSITFVLGVLGMSFLTAAHKPPAQTYVPAAANYQPASATR